VLDDLTIAKLLLIPILLLVALPIHEFSHALAAYRLGDGTAKLFGRLSLNPVVHFDPVGGTLLIITLLVPNSFLIFGWAKPTPVNPMNLRGGRRSDALVALAGPLSNFVLAAAAAIPFRVMIETGVDAPDLIKLRQIDAQIKAIEKWDGKLPSVTGGAVPFIQVEDLKK